MSKNDQANDVINLANTNKEDKKILKVLEKQIDMLPEMDLDQNYIKNNVSLYTSEKAINLNLKSEEQDGPFNVNHTLNGSNMLIYNKTGYLSSFNMQNYGLNFETNLNSEIHKATYLHNHKYIAVSQNNLFIYNHQGLELHCVRSISNATELEFLPYHFLLGCYGRCTLKYLDTSIGEVISELDVPSSTCMTSSDGLIYLGQNNGCVTVHAPLQKDALMKIKCSSHVLDVKATSKHLYTSSNDGYLKIFDIRNTFAPLRSKKIKGQFKIDVSQKNLIGLWMGKRVVILKENLDLYMNYKTDLISNIKFCPFEDIMSIGTSKGINNIVVPCSADSVYDCRENSPFLSKKERQELEVKKILEKIPADLISYKSIVGLNEESKKEKPKVTKRYYEKEEPTGALSRFFKK